MFIQQCILNKDYNFKANPLVSRVKNLSVSSILALSTLSQKTRERRITPKKESTVKLFNIYNAQEPSESISDLNPAKLKLSTLDLYFCKRKQRSSSQRIVTPASRAAFSASQLPPMAAKEAKSKKLAGTDSATEPSNTVEALQQVKQKQRIPNLSLHQRQQKSLSLKNVTKAFGEAFQAADASARVKKEEMIVSLDSTLKGTDLRKTNQKLKKGLLSLNLLRIMKLTVLFAINNLLTYCRAACPGGTTSVSQSSAIAGTTGATSHQLPNRGYSLTQSKMWKADSDKDAKEIYGFELTYSSDCCGYDDIVHMYGTQQGSNIWSVSIAQKVTAVKLMYEDDDWELRDIWFTLADGSTAKTCNCDSDKCDAETELAINANKSLVGLATRAFTSSNYLAAENPPSISIWIDNVAQCSECTSPPNLSFASTIANKTYYLTCSKVTTESFGTNLGLVCPTYTFSYQKDNNALGSSPTWLTYNSTTRKFAYEIPNNLTQIGTYTITVNAAQNSQNISFSFNILVEDDICKTTTFSAQMVNDFNYQIAAPAQTQTTPFPNTVALAQQNPTYCGAKTFSFSPPKTFLHGSGNIIQVVTSNPADVGTFDITVTVSLAVYPLVPSIDATFKVIISCVVSTLTFQTFPVSTTLQVGIDAQPKDVAFATTQNPACGNIVTFSLSPNQSFLSLEGLTQSGGNFRINGAAITNRNTYAQVVTATVNGRTSTQNFSVIIKDPCSTSVFETTPVPVADFSVNMPSSATFTQNFTIKTDVQVTYPTILCPIITTLSPTADYISLSGNTISVNASSISIPQNYGSNLFRLTVNSLSFSGSVNQKTYEFNVIVTCAVQSLTVTSQPSDTIYTLNQGPLVTAAFTVLQADVCNFSFTYTFTFQKNGTLISQPTWLTWDNSTRKLQITITAKAEVGTYLITTIATILQNAQNSNTILSKNSSFTLTVQSDCVNTVIADKTIRDMITKVSQTQDSQSVSFYNSKATLHNDASYCGATTLTFVPTLPVFLQITGNDLILSSYDPNLTGFYNFVMIIGLQDFPLIPKLTKPFKATIQCEVQEITAIPNLIADQKYRILIDSPLILPFKFTETPQCGLTVTYSVQPTEVPFKVVLSDSPDQITITSQSLKDSGLYKFTLNATSLRPASPLLYLGASMNLDFTLEIIDICRTTKFFKQQIPNIEILRQSPAYRITQNLPLAEFVYDAKTIHNFDCGKVSKKLYLSKTNQTQTAPDWISVSDQEIAINFRSQTSAYNQAIDLFVSLEDYPFINLTSTFNVTLSDAEIKCMDGASKMYQIKSEPLSFSVQIQNKTSVVNIKITRIQELIFFKNDKEIQQPSFVKVDKLLKFFTIDAGQLDDVGNYKIGWKLGYAEYPESQVVCTAPVQITYVPKFKGNAIDLQSLACNFPWSLKVPTYTDLFEQTVSLSVILGDTTDFLSYNEATQTITADYPDLLRNYIGKHQIKLFLIDNQKVKNEIEIDLVVMCFDQKGNSVETAKKHIVYQLPPPHPYIKNIDNLGQLRVAFTRPILLPTLTRFPEFETENLLSLNCTNGGICKNPTRRLNSSLIQVAKNSSSELNQALEIVNRGLVQVDNAKIPVVNLGMIAGPNSNLTELEFTWKCVDFHPDYMDFILNFTYVQVISIRDWKDKLNVTFTGNKYFTTEDGQSFDEQKTETKPFFIPQQVNLAYANQLVSLAKTVGNSSKAALLLNFFINLFLGGALSQLFSTIKKVSLMVHLLIINVNIPANAQVFFKGLLGFVNFNLINIEKPIRKGLNLNDEKIINQQFYDLGYTSSYAIINFGNMFVVMCIYAVLFIFIGLTTKIQNERIKKLRKYLVSKLMWNQTLSFMSESYMLLAISCLTNFSYFKFTTFGEIFSGIFAQLGTIVLVLFPALLLRFMHNERHKMKDKEFRESLSPIYENLSPKGDNATVLEPFISMVRVLIFTSMLIYLQDFRYFQIFISNFLVVFMIIYVGWYQPYKAKIQYWNQYNEVFVSIMNYHILCFADFIQDESAREVMGFSMIAFLCFNLLTNIGSIILHEIKKSCARFRLKYYNWKLQKIKKHLNEQQAAALKCKKQKQISPRLQCILSMRKNGELPFQKVPDDSEAVEILQDQKNSVQELQKQVKLNQYIKGQKSLKPQNASKNSDNHQLRNLRMIEKEMQIANCFNRKFLKQQQIPQTAKNKSLEDVACQQHAIRGQQLKNIKIKEKTLAKSSVQASTLINNQDYSVQVESSKISVNYSSVQVLEEVNQNNLSVISEALSIEEEEKKQENLKSEFKKANDLIFNSSTLELKNAVQTPRFSQRAIKKLPDSKMKKINDKKQGDFILAKFKILNKDTHKVTQKEIKPTENLVELVLKPFQTLAKPSKWQSDLDTYEGPNRSPHRLSQRDKALPLGFLDRQKSQHQRDQDKQSLLQDQDKQMALQDADKPELLRMDKFKTMNFVKQSGIAKLDTLKFILPERRDGGSKFQLVEQMVNSLPKPTLDFVQITTIIDLEHQAQKDPLEASQQPDKGLLFKEDDDYISFMDKRLTDPYKQLLEIQQQSSLEDAFQHSQRVKRRQKEAADVFKTVGKTQSIFEQLWRRRM